MELNLPASVVYEKRGPIAIITMNRSEAMNSLTKEMLIGLEAAFDDFEADPALHVAIFTGAGERAFCTGLDLKVALPALNDGDAMGYEDPAKRPFQRNFKPIITAVNGVCVAGGLEFMLGTDIRIAAEHARFGLPEVHWAIIPGGGSHVRLPRQIPYCHAMDIILTGRQITAQEALAFGLINKVVPADQVMAEAERYAKLICSNGPLAVQAAKEAVINAYNQSWEEAFRTEALIAERVFKTEDAKEGPRSFAEKREPVYHGR